MGKYANIESKVERKALLYGFFINVFMGIAGWYMFLQTDIDALFLDGNFSLISALGCVAAILISKYSEKKTKRFPNGMHFLEPLYATLKGLLSLTLIVIAGFSAIVKLYNFLFLDKGSILEMGGILYYSLLMTFLCFLLAGVFGRYNKKINDRSTILGVESKASFVDGIISLGLGVAILLITLLPKEGNTLFVYYIGDALITLILIIFTIRTPIEAFKESFTEVMYGTIRKGEVKSYIENLIKGENDNFVNLIIDKINIHKVGKKLDVLINLAVKDQESKVVDILHFRRKLLEKLQEKYKNVNLNIVLEWEVILWWIYLIKRLTIT